ncbi:hypothetical protein V1505DRAFT_318477, partial [Lipomyces doorenjongii]
PIPQLKRFRGDRTREMQDRIEEVFAWLQSEYRGCPLCALEGHSMTTSVHDLTSFWAIAREHNLNNAECTEFFEGLDVELEGTCYGCGLSLQVLNGIEGHIISRECSYSKVVRLICCDVIFNKKLVSCLAGTDPGALEVGRTASVTRWLKQTTLGEIVNNLTKIVYNWIELTCLEAQIISANAVRASTSSPAVGQREPRQREPNAEAAEWTLSIPTLGSGFDIRKSPTIDVAGSTTSSQMQQRNENLGQTAELLMRFLRKIKDVFHGCPICAVSSSRVTHRQDMAFSQVMIDHGYNSREFVHFEAAALFRTPGVCYQCSLPRKFTSRVPEHRSGPCPFARITRGLCFVAWKQQNIRSYLQGFDQSDTAVEMDSANSFGAWLTTFPQGSTEHRLSHMTHFVVNMLRSAGF